MATHRLLRHLATPTAVAATLLPATPAGATGFSAFPATIRSTAMTTNDNTALPRGTAVKASDVTQKVSLGGDVRAGLGDRGSLFGSVYPVLSTDGGAHWRIDGPRFYRAAADAPDVTTRLASLGHHTLIAWGRGGNFVKTTTDRGRHWYQADFPAGVYSAHVHAGRLIVRAIGDPGPSGRFPTRRYSSYDGGRLWHRGHRMAAIHY
ncbi:MAG TPA: hypothetical protein VHE57_07225 [Mycobacteriales bacterium]|nr:hypothetical protein [Mycobacteriales bacterium]